MRRWEGLQEKEEGAQGKGDWEAGEDGMSIILMGVVWGGGFSKKARLKQAPGGCEGGHVDPRRHSGALFISSRWFVS